MQRRGFFSSLLTFGAFQTACMATAGVKSPTDLAAVGPIYRIKPNGDVYKEMVYLVAELDLHYSLDKNALEKKRKEVCAYWLQQMHEISGNIINECFSTYLKNPIVDIRTTLKILATQLKKHKQKMTVSIEHHSSPAPGDEPKSYLINSIKPANAATVELYEMFFHPLFIIVEEETEDGVLTVRSPED